MILLSSCPSLMYFMARYIRLHSFHTERVVVVITGGDDDSASLSVVIRTCLPPSRATAHWCRAAAIGRLPPPAVAVFVGLAIRSPRDEEGLFYGLRTLSAALVVSHRGGRRRRSDYCSLSIATGSTTTKAATSGEFPELQSRSPLARPPPTRTRDVRRPLSPF